MGRRLLGAEAPASAAELSFPDSALRSGSPASNAILPRTGLPYQPGLDNFIRGFRGGRGDPADPQVRQGPADLCRGGIAVELLFAREWGARIAVEDAMPIRVDGDGDPVARIIWRRRRK